jgi:hypothetical protein
MLRVVVNHKIETEKRKDKSNDQEDPYHSDIDETNFNISYVNVEEAKYIIS